MNREIIKLNNLTKIYSSKNNKICILKNIDFTILKGDIISISGPSGSGKSTLLNILGLLDYDYSGEYSFLGKITKKLNFDQKNILRNQSIGFVHQFFHLIPELSVLENVSLPSLICGSNIKESEVISKDILVNFGLEHRIYSKPIDLSGGEQQRVSIARALINNPEIIFADEMTGNLDEKTSNIVFDFFLDKIKQNNQTLIYVTHNKEYSKKANKSYEISNENLFRLI